MTEYQCYFLLDGLQIGAVEIINARDDAEARDLAKRAMAARLYHGFELWSENQRVGSEFADEVEPPSAVTSAGTSCEIAQRPVHAD
jgi:hypothetical protein